MSDYLSQRKQRVKIGETTSTWLSIIKGVPQGSIMGPLLFNVFMNDMFLMVNECKNYNYADDNTLSDTHHDIDILIENLERSAVKAIDWFEANQMLANPANFNYCPLVWHFCGQAETKKIEKLHHRALRFVFKSNESYCTLLKRANLCSLKNSRLRLIALEVYKILHKEAPRILHDLVEL